MNGPAGNDLYPVSESIRNVTSHRPRDDPGGRTGAEEATTGGYVVGVDNVGGRLLDAILSRRETDADGVDSRALWDRSTAGFGLVGASEIELERSYFATGYADAPAADVAAACSYTTHTDAIVDSGYADLLTAYLDRAASWDEAWGGHLPADRLRAAQSVWLLHGVPGRVDPTPALAGAIREVTEDDATRPSPVLSVSVLPDSEAVDRDEGAALLDVARLAPEMDAILPVQYRALEDHEFGIPLGGFAERRNEVYESSHGTAVGFLELLWGFLARREGVEPRRPLDVADLYAPVRQFAPAGVDDPPAPVLAPAVGRLTAPASATSDLIEVLLYSTFSSGRLVEFDPSTAWGSTLVFCGPEEAMESVAAVLADGTAHDLLAEEYDLTNLAVGSAVVSDLDDVFLLALSWNPRLPVLERGFEFNTAQEGLPFSHATAQSEEGTPFSRRVDEHRDATEDLLAQLRSHPNREADESAG